MSKDRKSKNKESKKNTHTSGDAQYILSLVKTLGREATLKNLFPKIVKKISQEAVILALHELERKGAIRMEQKGKIKILQREAPQTREQSRNPKFVFGIIDITRKGDGFLSVEGEEKDIFIPGKLVRNAMQGDAVKVRLTIFGRRPEGEVVEIIKRNQDSFTGRLDVLEKFAFFIADEKKLNTDVFVPLHMLNGAKPNDKVIVRVTDWNTDGKRPIGEVTEILTGQPSSDLDMKMILISNGFSTDFPHGVYEELAKVPHEIPMEDIARRLDYRNILTFTIDPEDAKDFDDAISIRKLENGNTEIGVHIADVSHYIKEGSQLDIEAEKRATSVYLPDRVCPMLPERLSNELCSLRPNEDKLTFSTIFEFSDKMEVVNYTIAKTIIHSKRRFSYEEAQQRIETGEGDYAEEMLTLNKISKHIRAKRFKKGAIAFEKAEVRFKLDETGKPLGVVLKIRKDSNLLVEDFMLLANETVAKFGAKIHKGKKAWPFVYRVHDKPDPAKLEMFSTVAARFGYNITFDDPRQAAEIFNTLLKQIEGKPEQNALETLAIRSMSKAEYTTNNLGHYGLAMEYYTHFTSPIRRYPDVLVHRLTQNLLSEHSDLMIDKEELESRCKNSSLMERKAMDAEREATKYKQIEFLQDKVGEEYDGVITGVIARGVFVEMNENKCEGMISTEMLGDEDFVYEDQMVRLVGRRSNKKYQLGDKVRVQILSADLILRRIDLKLVD
ncbi:MAG: ribonuclease R [Chitinophagales bacterium]|nr:ribonuclease R [Chitinophagales bacterium]